MEIRQVTSFVAVVEEGGFAAAARRLFLSPPAVTAHVKQLERELGTRLLERSPFGLTPAGHRFLPHARHLLTTQRLAVAAVGDPERGRPAELRVGVMAHGSAELTPAAIHAFSRPAPTCTCGWSRCPSVST